MKHAYRLLLAEIDAKQRAWGAGHIYQRPTLHQCRTVLKGIDSPSLVFAREGEEAYRNRCEVSLSRNPDSLRADDLWVTDQREGNVILQDAGHQLGRIWKVNDLDVASFRWLGYAFGPVLDSDMVMTAHTRAIAKDGHLPGAIHHDQGKEFRCTAFNGGFRRISGEALYRESTGFWQRVEVTPVGAIGGNPQSKTIERWHAEVDKFDKRFLTWCGGNTDERPELLSAIIAQHRAFWFHGEGKDPGIPTIEEYITAFVDWCEKEWNAEHHGKGKYLRGMTPDQAYYAKRRPEGFRLISLEELEAKSAEHRMVTVRRGGQVNLTFWGVQVEYIAPELFQFAGAQPPVEVEVIISRRDFSAVTVLYPVPGGQESCVATIKSQMDWLPKGEEAREKLRAAMRAKNHAKRAVREGIKAHQQLADAENNPIALLEIQQGLAPNEKLAGQKTFGTSTPPPLGHPEISSTEFRMQHRKLTAEEVAEHMMRLREGGFVNAIREKARVALGVFQSRSGLSLKEIARGTGDSYFSMRHLAAGTEHRRNGSAIAERVLEFIRTHPPLGHESPGRLYETDTTRKIDRLISYCQAGGWGLLYGPTGAQKSYLLKFRAAEAASAAEPSLALVEIPGPMTPCALLGRIAREVGASYSQSAEGSARFDSLRGA